MTLEEETLRMREGEPPAERPARRGSPVWRIVAFVVLFGFVAILIGSSWVRAPEVTGGFLLTGYFLGLAALAGRVHELRREVAALREELSATRAERPPGGGP